MTNIYGVSSASATNTTLGVDGIREYRVITNSFSAEYGMTMGSQMIVVSKGGTNTFHGDVFEYLRNSALDARNFFDYKSPASQRRLPSFTRNNFGGAFGGPIKKEKTFFYGVYEGIRERAGQSLIRTTIPTSAKVDGGLVAQINPVIKPLLAFFPDPNLPGNQFTWPFSQPATDNYGQMRVDHNFSDKDNFFARYTIQNTTAAKVGNFPLFGANLYTRDQWGTLSSNHVLSPALLNTARFSYSRVTWDATDFSTEPSGPTISAIPGEHLGAFTIGGISPFGSNCCVPFLRKRNVFTYSDDIFYTHGRHSLKFGTLINRQQQEIESYAGTKGSASFSTLNNFLLGQATQIQANVPGSGEFRNWRYTTFGVYVQDDLRVRSNLTLNLGLRYEFNTIPQEVHGQWGVVKNMQTDATASVGSAMFGNNPSLKNFVPRLGFAWDVKGDGKTAIRGGFSEMYDLIQTTAAVYSVGSSHGNYPDTIKYAVANPPVFAIPITTLSTFPATVTQALQLGTKLQTLLQDRLVDWNPSQPHILQYNLTVERQLTFDMALTVAYAGSRAFNLSRTVEGNPVIPTFLAGGQEFYPVGAPRVNPAWASFNLMTQDSNSWYNGLRVGLLKRVSKGLQFQSSYTWSKTIDENQGNIQIEGGGISSPYPTDPFHRSIDRGPAGFDVTQVFKFNSIYRLPKLTSSGGVAGKLLNGWWVSGILSLQSGQPFTPNLTSNRSRSVVNAGPAGVDRPDLVLGVNPYASTSAGCFGFPAGTPTGNVQHYFDPCAFSIPAAGFIGTAGRDILRGPGFANLDFSLVKDTAIHKLGESGKLEFRAEIFNILNHANLDVPNITVFAGSANVQAPLATAGQITDTAGASRQIQLALKLIF